MSTQNQISVVIPHDVLSEVTQKLQDCRTALAPYLQGLTDKERKTIFKMGDKTVATVQKAKSYMQTNPEFIPGYMDHSEFLKDESIVTQLSPIANLAAQLWQDTEDTVMLAGSEALMAAMLYYGNVKEANSKGIVTAGPVYEDLSERFAKRARQSKPSV